ncbi:uncharacterized protein LOC131686921 [Topomyia yanbarensis]|uniref:uncharacterized protein LOC131686921 n=1 Tax=Topomyia yanbarensis TaxID=2498891 RepID=UPI00273AC604|nr:uncharacterized protein LOC131686921 [Topomyia yanbarensis]
MGIYEAENTHNNGVTNIKLAGDKVIVARLSGRIDFLRLETYTQGCQIDWGFTSAYGRTHERTGSAGSISLFPLSAGSNPSTALPAQHHVSEEYHGVSQQGHRRHVWKWRAVQS